MRLLEVQSSLSAQSRVRRSMAVLIKPTSSRCNLNCAYCFYLPKMELYPWKDHPKLTLDTFEEFLRQYIPLSAPLLSFMWQGESPR